MSDKIIKRDSFIWDFPSLAEIDESITKLEYVTNYEDSHGNGSLVNSDFFSYTTNNEDIWLLPSKSYLKLECKIAKDDDTDWAAADKDMYMSNNGLNIFEEARYYVNDVEVERIDHVGIATLINNLISYDVHKSEINKYSQWWFTKDEAKLKAYSKTVRDNLHLLLPLERIFPFFRENRHVFRGVKHRITLTLNSSDNILLKSDVNKDTGTPKCKFQIKSMEWIMPYVEPSLEVQAKLENQLARDSSFPLSWSAISVYRNQPPKSSDVRLALSSTVHKPTHIYIAIQKLERIGSQNKESMKFDSLKLDYVNVEVNGVQFPNKNISNDFAKYNIHELYERFLEGCTGTIVDFETFRETYPIVHIDVSKHKPELYANTTFPQIAVNIKFGAAPTVDYVLWVVVYNEREATLSLDQKQMRVLK